MTAVAGREEPVAILCGGRGTRLQERTHAIPKALVEIGGRPILWHVLRIYAAHGFRRFLLLCGYRGEMIAEFAAAAAGLPGEVEIECIDTGLDTPTGGRIAAVAGRLAGGCFALTYADGVADVDLGAALEFHRGHGAAATVTLVRPHSQWGIARLGPGDRIDGFVEKPRIAQWVNGGFMFCEPRALAELDPHSVLERGPLERLAAAGELRGWRHDGFWDCLDTYKDAVVLNDLWAAGSAPWRIWERGRPGAGGAADGGDAADAGAAADAGCAVDAGSTVDAGAVVDAGHAASGAADAGSTTDAGAAADAGSAAR